MSSHKAHPGHVLHEDGQRPLHRVPQAAVVLDDPLVAQVLQKLDLTLQRAHFLNRRNQTSVSRGFPADAVKQTGSHLAGLWTLWVKLDLFHCQFPSSVGVVAEEDPTEGALTQQLPQTPVGWSPRSWRQNPESNPEKQPIRGRRMEAGLTAARWTDVHDGQGGGGAQTGAGLDVAAPARPPGRPRHVLQVGGEDAAAAAGAGRLLGGAEADRGAEAVDLRPPSPRERLPPCVRAM